MRTARAFTLLALCATLATTVLALGADAGPNPPAQQAADSGPSLKETLDWLRDKLKNDTASKHKNQFDQSIVETYQIDPIDFSGCEVSWTVIDSTDYPEAPNGSFTDTVRYKITLPLYQAFHSQAQLFLGHEEVWLNNVDVNSEYVKIESELVRTYSDGTQKTDSWVLRSDSITSSPRHPFPIFHVGSDTAAAPSLVQLLAFDAEGQENHDMSVRVATAFNHAIQLCQNQKPDPHPGEPF